MAKTNIEAYVDYDKTGRWRLIIEKKRGKLSLDEIRETAREWEWDYYLLVLDCYHDPYDIQYIEDPPPGDRVELYRTDLLNEERN